MLTRQPHDIGASEIGQSPLLASDQLGENVRREASPDYHPTDVIGDMEQSIAELNFRRLLDEDRGIKIHTGNILTGVASRASEHQIADSINRLATRRAT
jgi:hypothetical protein